VSSPGYRAVTFDDLRTAYGEQINGLLDGGADLLLVEPSSTPQRQAALYAIAENRGSAWLDVPMMIPPITDKSGRLLSGQLAGGFWNSVRHASRSRSASTARSAPRIARAYLRYRRVADTLVCAYPNAGLPKRIRPVRRNPEYMARLIGEFASAGLSQYRRRLLRYHARSYRGDCSRGRAAPTARDSRNSNRADDSRVSSVRADAAIPFVNVGERTNVTAPPNFEIGHCRRLHPPPCGGARPGRERRPDHRRQSWTKGCWIPKPRW